MSVSNEAMKVSLPSPSDSKDDSLTSMCSVCGSPAAAHLHYGAVSCYSCRAFFRRGPPKQIRCIFGHGKCQISQQNRTNCKMCRYNRCLEVGMKPDKVDRFLVKKKERKAQVTSTQNDQVPNRSPSSEACSQKGSQYFSSNTTQEFEKQKRNEHIHIRMEEPGHACKDLFESHFSKVNEKNIQTTKQSLFNIKNKYDEQKKYTLPDKVVTGSIKQNFQEVNHIMNKNLCPHPDDDNAGDFKQFTPNQPNWKAGSQFKPSATATSSYVQPDIYTQTIERNRSMYDNSHPDTGRNGSHDVARQCSYDISKTNTRNETERNIRYDISNYSSHDISRNIRHGNATYDMNNYMMPGMSYRSYNSHPGGKGWGPDSKLTHSSDNYDQGQGGLQSAGVIQTHLSGRENGTSVIARNYLSCKVADSMETESMTRIKVEEVKEEVTEGFQSQFNINSSCDRFMDIDALNSTNKKENKSEDQIMVPLGNISSLPKRKYPEDAPAADHKYQPYRSVIQRNMNSREHLTPRHRLADYSEVQMPRPMFSTINVLNQKFEKQGSYSEATTEVTDTCQVVNNEETENNKEPNPKKTKIETLKTEVNNQKCQDAENEYSPSEGSLFPLKKRQRMMEIPYSTGHGIDKNVIPVISFTFEEEFRVMDYIVRIEQYQNRRFDFLNQNFQRYKELTATYVACTHSGRKIPFNKALESQLFKIGLEFTKQASCDIFEEIGVLSSDVRREVLNSTYPALYVVMWAILEGNTREKTWMDQHMKTLHITKENHAAIKDNIRGLENVRSISLKDQERFTSPWAVEMVDEEKFERTVSLVGRLLRDDIQLQALYHMLVMLKPSGQHSPNLKQCEELATVQSSLCQFIYRYLAAKDNTNLQYTKTSKENCNLQNTNTSMDNTQHQNFKTSTYTTNIQYPKTRMDNPSLKCVTTTTENMHRSVPETEASSSSSIMSMSEHVEHLNPDEKTRLLISLVDDLHDCVDIMHYRSLLVQAGRKSNQQ